MADNIVGSVGVRLLPAAEGFAEDVRAKLRGLTADVNLNAVTERARAQIEELTRPRDMTVNVNADTGGAAAEIAALDAASSGASGGLAGLAGAAALIAPAMIPAAAAVAGLAAALAAPALAIGGGLLAFAGVAAGAISGTLSQSKKLSQASTAAASSGISSAQRALQEASAAQAVKSAQEGLTRALYEQVQAQKALTTARKDAQEQLEDLANQLIDAQLNERSDQLAVVRAQQELAQTNADPTATAIDRQEAQLAYDQAVQSLKEQQTETVRLQAKKAAADKAGVEGSQEVLDAQHQVKTATQAVADAHTRVALAKKQAAAAGQSGGGGGGGGGIALAAVKPLTAAQKTLLAAIANVKKAFSDLLNSKAGAAVFATLSDGLNLFAAALPAIAPLVLAVSHALQDLIANASKAVKSGSFATLVKVFAAIAGPAIKAAATILADIAKGFVSMALAATPLAGPLLDHILKWANGFSKAGQSAGFQGFIAYVQKVGPQVAATLSSIGHAFGNIVKAVAPLGGVALAVIKGIADVIAKLPVDVIGSLVTGLVAGVAAFKLVTIATAAWKTVTESAAAIAALFTTSTEASNAALLANPIGLIIAAIVALVAAFIYAYKHSETFRDIVNGAFNSVKGVAQSVASFFTSKIPAAFARVRNAASAVFSWVKDNWPMLLGILTGPIGIAASQIVKHWDAIKSGAKDMWGYIKSLPGKIKGAFTGIWGALADGLKAALNHVLHLPIKIPKINTHIPGVGKVGGQTLIPALANGGITNGPTLALIGDNRSGREAVIPLDRSGNLPKTLVEAMRNAMPAASTTSASGTVEIDYERLARAMANIRFGLSVGDRTAAELQLLQDRATTALR